MTTITLSVPDMSCGHCVAAITRELDALDGVATIDVSLDTKTVRVDGDVDRASVVAAIGAAGYDAA